jgi:cytidine deaminase
MPDDAALPAHLEPAQAEQLLTIARKAAARAYAPYSKFSVGAAVLDDQGRVHAGCNVENASFGLTVCAERHAVAAAVLAGARHLRAVAIYTPTDLLTPPCGACRQVLSEFGGNELEVLMVNRLGEQTSTRLGELLPSGFQLPAGPAPVRD